MPEPSPKTADQRMGEAMDLLEAAGFVLSGSSAISEAVYFRWPDRSAQLRVATHRMSRRDRQNTAAELVLYDDNRELPINAQAGFEADVNQAIGRYFLNSKPVYNPQP